MKKLIKYEKQKSRNNEKRNVDTELNSESLFKKKQNIMPKNYCKNLCCNKKNNDVFDRLSQPSSKTKLCSKAVSTVGVQTDSLYTETSMI